jgi:hypothetical protein
MGGMKALWIDKIANMHDRFLDGREFGSIFIANLFTMTRSLLLLLLFMGFSATLSAQPCNCRDEFLSLRGYMEKNYAGFRDKVTDSTRPAYDSVTAATLRHSARAGKPLFCLALMREWLQFFQDGHNSITSNLKFGSPYPGGEKIRLTASRLAALEGRGLQAGRDSRGRPDTLEREASPKRPDMLERGGSPERGAAPDIEGIYYYSDSTYKIAIVKSKTPDRDFAGVMLASRAPNWEPGQVKLELTRISPNHFSTIMYMRDHSADVEDLVFDGSSFNKGEWFRAGTTGPHGATVERPLLQARQLSSQTFYIGIGSFDDPYASAIDSLVRADSALLRSMPNLILDLRGNGGGSDFVYEPLAPLLYGGPVHGIGVDVLATTDNIKSWSTLLDSKYITGWTRYSIQNSIARMKTHPGQFISVTPDHVATLPMVRPFPQRVAVLVDGACASTTEQFLLEAVQSQKVVVMGQHTAGVLDYSNVRQWTFDCLPFTLHYCTTRSRRIDQGKGIDNVGIQPAVVLGDDVDWVEAARKYLEQ